MRPEAPILHIDRDGDAGTRAGGKADEGRVVLTVRVLGRTRLTADLDLAGGEVGRAAGTARDGLRHPLHDILPVLGRDARLLALRVHRVQALARDVAYQMGTDVAAAIGDDGRKVGDL